MTFVYEGHDAAGKEASGTVEAKTIEDAAQHVRTALKVYARKIEPAKIQATQVDHRQEAVRLVREQAEIMDNHAGKAYVYTPSGDSDTAQPEKYCRPELPAKMPPAPHVYDQVKVAAGGPSSTFMASGQMSPEEILVAGLKATDKVIGLLESMTSSGKSHEFARSDAMIEKLRSEMVRQAVLNAWNAAK